MTGDGIEVLKGPFLGKNGHIAVRTNSIPRAVVELKKRGYEFATVSQIFKMKNVTPKRGWLYSNVLQTESDNRL